MIHMVKWQDVVGKDKLNTFTAIQLAVTDGVNKQIDEDTTLDKIVKSGKANQADVDMWKDKRHMMRRCGYEEYDKKSIRFHGWYQSVIDHGELMFKGTANPDQTLYISMDAYLKWLRNTDTGEVKQYSVKSVVNRTGRELGRDHARYEKEWDETFVEESA